MFVWMLRMERFTFYHERMVVEEVEDDELEIELEEAQKRKSKHSIR